MARRRKESSARKREQRERVAGLIRRNPVRFLLVRRQLRRCALRATRDGQSWGTRPHCDRVRGQHSTAQDAALESACWVREGGGEWWGWVRSGVAGMWQGTPVQHQAVERMVSPERGSSGLGLLTLSDTRTAWVLLLIPTAADPCLTASIAYSSWWSRPCGRAAHYAKTSVGQ